MPLQVIIVGAGIGGLSAAVALRRAGHHVQVFEKSQFASEVGAAVALTPNGTRVLDHLGFDWVRARADAMSTFEVVDGVTLAGLHRADTSHAVSRLGAPFWTIHRVDLHNELLRLALAGQGNGECALQLGSRVLSADPDRGSIILEDGSEHVADLVIGADGLRSVLRGEVLGQAESKPTPSGLSAFRFMIPTAELKDEPAFQELLSVKGRGNSVFADTSHKTERHMVWYTCRNGTLQNFGGIHDSISNNKNEGYESLGVNIKDAMLSEFGHYHPSLVQLMHKADRVTDWPLNYHDPLPTWVRGKMGLMGDAAHPMLPFGAQGSNQALEDAGALGELFRNVHSAELVPGRLALYDQVRRLRASRIQTLSRVRLGKELEVQDQLRRFADPISGEVPTSFAERQTHDYG